MKERKPSDYRNLNDLLRQNPTWEAFAEAVTAVTRKLVDEPRWKLERLRHHTVIQRGDFFDTERGPGRVSVVRKQVIDPDTGLPSTTFLDDVEIDLGDGYATHVPMRTMPERPLMVNNNVTLGFDFFSDKLSDADLQRIMRYVQRYWPTSGNANFMRFISYIKNIRFDMRQLNTPDYGDPDKDPSKDPHLYLETFMPSLEEWTYNRPGFAWDKETPPAGFGGVYPTSHVELHYDPFIYTDPDFQGTTELFYFLAPIHLVLQRYAASIFAPEFSWRSGTTASFDIYDSSRYEFNLDETDLVSSGSMVASFDQMDYSVLCLDDDFNSLLPMPEVTP